MRWLVVLAACGPAVNAPEPARRDGIPGLAWITPAQPFRIAGLDAIALDGDHAIVAIGKQLATFDLATGALGTLHPIDDPVRALLHLDGRRWLAVSAASHGTAAFVIDGDTLATTPVPLDVTPDAPYGNPSAARLSDGTIAITGAGLPLASYDPMTWKRVRVIDPAVSWSAITSDGDVVYGIRDFKVIRIDASGATPTGIDGVEELATAAGHLVLAHLGTDTVEVVGKGATIGKPANAFALDPSGARMATVDDDAVRIYTLPSGKELAFYKLGPSARVPGAMIAFDTKHVVVGTISGVHVIDLESGKVSPPGAPPFGIANELAVRDDGAILAVGEQAWRIVDGRITTTSDTTDDLSLELPPGELHHYATYEVKGGLVTLRSVDDARVRTWKVEYLEHGWLGDNGEIAYTGTTNRHLWRSANGQLVQVFGYDNKAKVLAADVDGETALVGLGGAVHVVSLRDGAHGAVLRAPGCEAKGAWLEHRGGRIALAGEHDVVVWTHDGKQVASLATTEPVDRVQFVPGRDELALEVGNAFELWDFEHGRLRRVDLPEPAAAALSPDGHRVAWSFEIGRVALADVDKIRSGGTDVPVKSATVPARCEAASPFAE